MSGLMEYLETPFELLFCRRRHAASAGPMYMRSLPKEPLNVVLCNDWNPSLAQSSDFHWSAELRSVRPRNLEQSTSFATSPRTVAEHLQAPLVCN